MLGADERGVRRTCRYAAATSEESNDADRKNHKPANPFCPATAPVWYNGEQIFGKKGEKIRQEKDVGGPWRPNWVCPGIPLERSFVISMTSLFPWTNAATAWRSGGGGMQEKPGPGPNRSNCGVFSRWRMERRACPEVSAHDRIPGGNPVLRNKPSFREQPLY